MTMSKEYWVKRFEQEEERNSKVSLKQMQVAKKEYKKSISKIDDEIRIWYSKYATENNLSYQDTQKLLTSSEKKKLKLSLEEYIKLGEEHNIKFNPNVEKLLEQISSEVHINRLEALKSNLQAELDVLYSGIDRGLGNHFNDVINESYARTSYLVQSMSGAYAVIDTINQDLVNKIIFKPWTSDGVNWSNRLWKQKDKLIHEVHTALMQSLILGDNINTLADKVSTRLDVGYSRVANLLLTESAAYHSKATELCYKDLGVEKYEILATLDSRTSNICQTMDGKIFNRKDYKVGITAPPFHCRCRTTTIPYFEDLTEDETRAARDENNNPVEEKAAMKYGEWMEKYYGKNEEIQLKNNEKDSIITIEVDEMTPCLRRLKDNVIVKTEVKEIKYRKSDFKDWLFDWSKTEKKGYQILALYANGDNRIQGAISIKPKKENLTIEIDIAESAPFNSSYNKKVKGKEYNGVGAHLFAEVCKRSFDLGYDGYVEFIAKTNLISYYQKELGAVLIGGQKMVIDEFSAKKLVDRYYKGGQL